MKKRGLLLNSGLQKLCALLILLKFYIKETRTLIEINYNPFLWLRNHADKTANLGHRVWRLQEFDFRLQNRPGPTNRVANALLHSPLMQKTDISKPHNKSLISAFIGKRCHSCWGQTQAFSTQEEKETTSKQQQITRTAEDLVHMGT